MVVFGVLNYLYYIIKSNSTILKRNLYEIMYVAGLFSYAPLTVVYFSLWNFLQSHQNYAVHKLNIIHSITNTTMYVFFTVGIVMDSVTGNKYERSSFLSSKIS